MSYNGLEVIKLNLLFIINFLHIFIFVHLLFIFGNLLDLETINQDSNVLAFCFFVCVRACVCMCVKFPNTIIIY
jgi:hypothetical protein